MGGARGGEEGREGEEVAGPGWAVGDEGKDLGDESLLYAGVLWESQLGVAARVCLGAVVEGGAYQLCIELGQPRLALAIKDQKCVDHSAIFYRFRRREGRGARSKWFVECFDTVCCVMGFRSLSYGRADTLPRLRDVTGRGA